MADAERLECRIREIKTRGYLNELKRNGMAPGTVYGKDMENRAIMLNQSQLSRIFSSRGSRGLFTLVIEDTGKQIMAVVREVQKHPINGQIVHVDFLQVSMDEKIKSTVSIVIAGEEELLRKGGVLQVGAKEIEVSCLPGDIPESIVCDVGVLAIGDKITVADLEIMPGAEIISEPETLIATILAPSRVAAEAEEPSEAGGEAE